MSYDSDGRVRGKSEGNGNHYASRDEVYSKRVLAGKRTYFFDVKSTRSGEDFLTITESKRVGDHRYEKHKIFLYKEDFGKFVTAVHDVIGHIRAELLPGYDFRGLPPLTTVPEEEAAHFVSESE